MPKQFRVLFCTFMSLSLEFITCEVLIVPSKVGIIF